VGARGFGPTYLQKGRSVETPARAHSLFFEVLGEDGLVGFLLLLGALGLPLAVVARRARSGDVVAVAALGAGVYWLTHAAVDWNWTVPAAGIPFFLLLGVGAGSDAEERPLARAAALAGAIASLVVAVFAFAPVWVSAKLTDRALDHPDSAASALRWAKRLDPLSTDPYVVQSALATTKAGAIEPLRNAVSKEPEVSSLHYLLGLAYLDAGQAAAARRELGRAHELAPRDPLVEQALERARGAS
jgi:O-antigen ligase